MPEESKPAKVAKGTTQQQQLVTRLADVSGEPLEILGPITGVGTTPRQPIMDAALATGMPGMGAHGFVAAEYGASKVHRVFHIPPHPLPNISSIFHPTYTPLPIPFPSDPIPHDPELSIVSYSIHPKALDDPHGLDADEAGSLTLYTAESELYPNLNSKLRQRDRKQLKPFFPFLKLMLDARAKLPKYSGTVWRGVKGVDLRGKYPKGKVRCLSTVQSARDPTAPFQAAGPCRMHAYFRILRPLAGSNFDPTSARSFTGGRLARRPRSSRPLKVRRCRTVLYLADICCLCLLQGRCHPALLCLQILF